MLALTRNVSESVIIGEGDNEVRLTIVSISRGQVRLSFDAPRHIQIDREEIRLRKDNDNGIVDYD